MANQAHYAALNDRHAVRTYRLRALGFKFEHIPGYDMAAYVRPRLAKKTPTTVPAAFVMHADEICWQDRLKELS